MKVYFTLIILFFLPPLLAEEIQQKAATTSASRYEKLKKEGLHGLMPAVDLKVDPSYQDHVNQQSSAMAKPPKLQDAVVPIQFAPQEQATVENLPDSQDESNDYQVPEEEFSQ